MKVIDYKILTSNEPQGLERAVKLTINNPDDPLDDSWQPHGPMIVERLHSHDQYAGNQHRSVMYSLRYIQAMVKVDRS